MRILLIDPPFYRFMGVYNRYFPVGLAGIAAVLRDAGHEVLVYDADGNDRPTLIDYTRLPDRYPHYLMSLTRPDDPLLAEVRDTLKRIDPELIGISIWTTFAASAFRIAEVARELFPDRPIVMGGPHASAKPDEVLRLSPATDYVVRGEGERTILELVEHIEKGRDNPASIPGVSCRENGQVRHAPPREKCRDLDEFPFPDRSLLMNRGKYSSEDMGLIMTSRGCPYSCSYCATEVGRTSYRSVEHILREIRAVKKEYGTVQFSFKDDSFAVDRRRTEELCDRILAERMNIVWECTTRANLVTESLLRKMKKAGCNQIKIGIESGSERILAGMNKGLTLDRIRQAARLLRKTGIYWTGFFMMGVPGETVEEIHQTLAFMHELQPDHAHIGSYEPFPGTAMFAEGVQRGLLKTDMTLDDFYRMLPNDYYKMDARRQVDTIDAEVFEQLEVEMKSRFHAYNRSMARIFRRAKSRSGLYLSQPAALVADFRKYLSWC